MNRIVDYYFLPLQKFIFLTPKYIKMSIHLERNNTQLKRGDRVRITEGPLVNMECELVSDGEDGNFCVSILGLDYSIITTINKSCLVPVEENTN